MARLQDEGPTGVRTTMVKVERIKIRKDHNTRQWIGNEPDAPSHIAQAFAALKESIRAFGGIWPDRPLTVYGDGDDWYIQIGYRRLTAVKELIAEGMKIESVPCVAADRGQDVQRDVLRQLAENENAQPIEPVDEARAYERMIHAGIAVEKIAEYRAVSLSVVKDRLALLNLNADTLADVAAGAIPLSKATKLGKRKTARKGALSDDGEKAEVAELKKNTIKTAGSGKPRLARGTKPAAKKKDDIWARVDTARGMIAAGDLAKWKQPNLNETLTAFLDYLTGEDKAE